MMVVNLLTESPVCLSTSISNLILQLSLFYVPLLLLPILLSLSILLSVLLALLTVLFSDNLMLPSLLTLSLIPISNIFKLLIYSYNTIYSTKNLTLIPIIPN